MAAIFQDGRHGLYWTTIICLKVTAHSQKIILGINDMYWTKKMQIWLHKQSNVQICATWLPFYNMANIDTDK